MRKVGGIDAGKLYALKQLKKASIVPKTKTTEHTITERQVLEAIRDSPFLVTLHYAFQTDAKLNLILGKILVSLLAIQFIIFNESGVFVCVWREVNVSLVCVCFLLRMCLLMHMLVYVA